MRFFFAGLVLGVTMPGLAQQTPHREKASVFVELAGNAAFGATVNVEARVHPHVALRAGIGNDFYTSTMVVPAQVVFMSSARRSAIEVSAGVTVAFEDSRYTGNWNWDGVKPFFTGFAGYRYQAPGGFLFRLGVVPLLWTNGHIPWVALSLGYTH